MGKIVLFTFCAMSLFSCSKNDDVNNTPLVSDTTLNITAIEKVDVNEVDISYIVKPPAGQTFSSGFLVWSTDPDFSTGRDSTPVNLTGSTPVLFPLRSLQQSKTYFCRLSVIHKGKRVFSTTKQWQTDSIKLLSINLLPEPWQLNKGDSALLLRTNLPLLTPGTTNSEVKIYLGSTLCSIALDQGTDIYFNIPPSIPSGKYRLELRRKSAVSYAKDSIEILRGRWTFLTPPQLPVNYSVPDRGLVSFGTCQSAQKGYIIGGAYFNGIGTGPESMNMDFILEYDPVSQSWQRRHPINPRYFQNPIAYHFNNSIYVIGGHQRVWDASNNDRHVMVKKMMRLNLSDMSWSDLDSMPHYGQFNLTSFELNNEWYIGMGADSANVDICCGVPLPSKKFWKYNPSLNQWTRLADFPGSHQVFPTCFSLGGKGYAFYGAIPLNGAYNDVEFRQEFWEYNPGTNNWRQIPLPASGGPLEGDKYQIITHNDRAYFLTAQKLNEIFRVVVQNSCLEWEPDSNTYKRVSFSRHAEVLRLVYAQNDKFVFQSEALGAFERIPIKTFLFDIND